MNNQAQTQIPKHQWLTKQSQHIIVAIHGLGGQGAWFQRLASKLNPEGISLYSLDLCGFGKHHSGHDSTHHHPKGHIDSYQTWLKDCKEFILDVHKNHPEAQITVLGHSLGAVIASNLLKDENPNSEFSQVFKQCKLILSVPGYKGAPETFNLWGFVIPTLLKYAINRKDYIQLPEPSDDFFKALEDPENHNPFKDPLQTTKVTANLLWEILQLGNQTTKSLAKLDPMMPVLMLQMGDDVVVCNKTISEYFRLIPSLNKELKHFDKVKHDWIWFPELHEVALYIATWIDKP